MDFQVVQEDGRFSNIDNGLVIVEEWHAENGVPSVQRGNEEGSLVQIAFSQVEKRRCGLVGG